MDNKTMHEILTYLNKYRDEAQVCLDNSINDLIDIQNLEHDTGKQDLLKRIDVAEMLAFNKASVRVLNNVLSFVKRL